MFCFDMRSSLFILITLDIIERSSNGSGSSNMFAILKRSRIILPVVAAAQTSAYNFIQLIMKTHPSETDALFNKVIAVP